MPTVDEEAIFLAQLHYQTEDGITQIFLIETGVAVTSGSGDMILLLEVNEYTVPAGIMPLRFAPVPTAGVHFPTVIVEVTPDEFDKIRSGELRLPNDWAIGPLLPKLSV